MSVELEGRIEAAIDLPWSREIYIDADGGYLARIPELPGCFADGDTAEEALARLRDVLADWLGIAFERGETIPAPRRLPADYSGRFSVRVPRSLHAALSRRAETEGCSLNQLVTMLLTEAMPGRAAAG
jgi:antitoxin HicB